MVGLALFCFFILDLPICLSNFTTMNFSGCLDDESLGPAVRGCRGDFDFTIKFEKIFFALIPAAVFIAVSMSRVVYLTRQPAIISGAWLRCAKLAALAFYAVIYLCLLVLSSARSHKFRIFLVSSTAVTFVSALCMLALSFLEHSRSPRPSILLNAYLFLTILLDCAQARTLWLVSNTADEITFSRLFTAGLALKSIIVLLESAHKSRWVVHWDVKKHSPEEFSGLFGLGAFFWLNKLFLVGYRKILTMDDLFPLDSNMASATLHARLADRLEVSKLGGKKYGLAKALAKGLAVSLLIPVGPRIALTAFNFCQPFLIETLLDYLQRPAEDSTKNLGYGLIGATLLIYTGIAVSGAFYWYFQERALYMSRGVLASAVYKKTTEAKLSAADDSASLTLMSADVERVIVGFKGMHDFWASLIEIALACWLLSRQIGASFVVPLIVVACCIICSSFLSRLMGPRQKAWMQRIQKRVGLTANLIGQMKHIKISGLAAPVEDSIQKMRADELTAGARFRTLQIFAVSIAYSSTYLSPALTFALSARTLDVTTVFTSLSYLQLLAFPLSRLFQMIPSLIAAFTCLDRIQAYLVSDPRVDFRESAALSPPPRSPENSENNNAGSNGRNGGRRTEMKITGGTFGWEPAANPSLKNLELNIAASRLTIVVGPIASGKSTLCKALLGEVPVYEGRVVMERTSSRKSGYCDQTPFLTNGTIRDNIVGFSPFDQARYNEVIEATVLLPDLAILPQGDNTKVGSNGITLSGGQKQRVSMARALYLDSQFLIFDDILSGLDADTEEQVFRRVFSAEEGLLRRRKATVVLCTHSVRHLPSAEHIVALGSDGSLVEQGSFQELMANKMYVSSLGVKASDKSSDSGNSVMSADDITRPEVSSKVPLIQPVSRTDNEPEEQGRMMGDNSVYRHYFSRLSPILFGGMIFACALWGFLNNFSTIWLKYWSEDVVSPNPIHSNGYYIGLYALLQISALLMLFIQGIITFTAIIKSVGIKLHNEALSTVINAPLRFFTTTDTGVVTNLFSQDMTLIDGELPMALSNFTLYVFHIGGMGAVIATASPFLAITYPFLFAVLYCVQRFYLRTSRQMRLLDLEAKSPLYTHFLDTIKGVATLRAFGWVQNGISLNSRLLDDSQRPMYLLAMIQRWLAFALQIIVAILAVAVVTLSTQMRANTAFTGVSLVTLMTFGDALSNIVVFFTLLETSIGAVSRLKTFSAKVESESKEGEDVVPPGEWPLKGGIQIRGVSASYGDIAKISLPSEEPEISSGERTPGSAKDISQHLALKDLDLDIAPGEKVAICGRTGSGKSSTILLLLRLLDPLPSCAENITIDDIPLHKLDRSTLRQRIIAVPQDPVFLPDGTSFQTNLDPFGLSAAAECQAVLETVGLWTSLALDTNANGLAAPMAADTLSAGQKQLFSLARAILRRRVRARERDSLLGEAVVADTTAGGGGLLLLDEVSSSVDKDTDKAMQQIIRDEFEGYTIAMVSHRLEMVMDFFDRVVVMDKGQIVESGSPKVLAETEGSRFRDLWLVGSRARE
ncbi:P-loop containing nucleoside triphosphate hydrolase protein [Podospora didyma]|uniref:P-loop containing nucleoside triphosphate hydrolase protein n=1 Tax=Podospora didyma TaxID=330526 RepID=A0AAE0NBS7_9PEZI|nr:P-loop containing nucleoside triphosphate hydrolase protein [Podospora didyma]